MVVAVSSYLDFRPYIVVFLFRSSYLLLFFKFWEGDLCLSNIRMATNGMPRNLVHRQAMNPSTTEEVSLQSQAQDADSTAEKENSLGKTQSTNTEDKNGPNKTDNAEKENSPGKTENTNTENEIGTLKTQNAEKENIPGKTENTNTEKGEESVTNATDTKDKTPKSPLAAGSDPNIDKNQADTPLDDRVGDLPPTKDDKVQNHNPEGANVTGNAGNAHPTPLRPPASSDHPAPAADVPSTTSQPLKLPPPGLRTNGSLPPPNVEGIPGDYWYVSYQLHQPTDPASSEPKKWYGAEGRFSTFRPKLEKGDHSILQMAIINDNGKPDELQTVETGWRRASTEAEPYFFSYTTNMGYKPAQPTDRKSDL